jgi:signal transduction histidine kinase
MVYQQYNNSVMENILVNINKAAIKFLAPLAPVETYKIIVKEAIKLVGADYGSILLEQEGSLKRVYASIKMAYTTQNRKKGNTFKSFSEQKVIVAPIKELGPLHPELTKFGVKWTIFIPLSYQKKSIGVLTINTRKEEKLDKRQFNALKLYGTLASLAIINTRALAETNKALETRDLFIALASHELKTPLTSINGYVQLLQKKANTTQLLPLPIIDNLVRETNRLTNLIKELLEINQVRSGSFHFSFIECNFAELIKQALTTFAIVSPSRIIRFKNTIRSTSDLIIGDPDKIIQVTLNLLHNAAKFSPASTEITVTLKEDKNYFIFTIQDQGKGISQVDLPHIFKDFYKGNDHTKEGMGLGLFLTKHIIDSHKGLIKVRSQENKGTIIEYKLPKIKNI